MITRRLLIYGKVQGVWYRESMRIEAEKLSVTGWVRNRRDGSVEAMVQGGEAAVGALIDWAWKGPPAARVQRIETSDGEGSFIVFERLPTTE